LDDVNGVSTEHLNHGDSPRSELNRHESSRAEGNLWSDAPGAGGIGVSLDDTLRTAIKLAIDASDYERAAALLELLQSKTHTVERPTASPSPLGFRRRG
jgi:hypothetical protein